MRKPDSATGTSNANHEVVRSPYGVSLPLPCCVHSRPIQVMALTPHRLHGRASKYQLQPAASECEQHAYTAGKSL